MTPRPVLVDTDPGLDDALAILLVLAHPGFALRGVTTLAGNIGLERTSANAGALLALAGRHDVPLHAGAAAPSVRAGIDEAAIHGADGLGGVALPAPVPARTGSAARFLAETLRTEAAGTIDLLCLGPLTNLARLLEEAPDAARRIGRVVAMGGTIREPGNVGPMSEFNLAYDPEAADAVLRAGLDLTLVPLDATRRVRASRDTVRDLLALSSPLARKAGEIVEAYFRDAATRESRPLHDPCVPLQLLRPDLFPAETLHLRVDRSDGPEAGRLHVDPTGAPANVALGADGEAALALFVQSLR
ncbi:nucleoside hydrolase [Aureimonas jatrophae]|uniref:Purine nucleosidase/pyrimidine-specific ribonucleoside hydrolase n=1 Tax=Aureimonas jatrophae TaxID=1166073 RepID=A0A1H0F5D9_9HYPH|nr:nucleoside hydrolase [Aureimonas jatrophae]MBB3950172.1 purine nucleosidase/pyrimidine-specific ribonucleoside hydrolase [Aureimonas jatrophae]SDN89802.1 purine nucleosidase/pyrimidine-specific ribonucleoside hydrolase [Aureimonas jatrophae]